MKKGFLGYRVSEVDIAINALREENESLNATIITLTTQLKNSESSSGVKASLLEADLKKKEDQLNILSEEKDALAAQLNSLTIDIDSLQQRNTELSAQIELLATQKADHLQQTSELKQQVSVLNQQITELTALNQEAAVSAEEALRLQLSSAASDLESMRSSFTAVTGELEDARAELQNAGTQLQAVKAVAEQKTQYADTARKEFIGLNTLYEASQNEIEKLKAELAASRAAADEYARLKAVENQAMEITSQAYYDMSKMRNEVMEYVHEQMMEYYQHINDNSVKMRMAIEQSQLEYTQMIREFFAKASEFCVNMSNIDNKYSDIVNYSLSLDELSKRLNEIMDSFLEESGVSQKIREELSHSVIAGKDGVPSAKQSDRDDNKPIVLKISG